jgi:hypothetical protein
MKNATSNFNRFFFDNILYVILVFGIVTTGFIFSNISNKAIAKKNLELRAAQVELVVLRQKINNHLIAEKFYEKPARVVIPVMKDFGIDL